MNITNLMNEKLQTDIPLHYLTKEREEKKHCLILIKTSLVSFQRITNLKPFVLEGNWDISLISKI